MATRKRKIDQLVSAKELAEDWGCHRTTVARLLKRAGIHPVVFTKHRNGMKRWRLREVEQYVQSRSSESGTIK